MHEMGKGKPLLEVLASALNEDYKFPIIEVFAVLYTLGTFVFANFANIGIHYSKSEETFISQSKRKMEDTPGDAVFAENNKDLFSTIDSADRILSEDREGQTQPFPFSNMLQKEENSLKDREPHRDGERESHWNSH